MQHFSRKTGIIILFALLVGVLPISYAQDNEPITVVGARQFVEILFPLFNNAAETSLDSTAEITGTSAGIQRFCVGDANLLGATRALTDAEESNCIDNEIQFTEYLLAYEILAIVAHPDIESPTCLTQANLNTLFAPSAAGQVVTWAETGLNDLDVPVTVVFPESTSPAYTLLDDLVQGFGLRRDTLQFVGRVADHVSNTPGAIGVTTLAEINEQDILQILELNTSILNECVAPSGAAVANRQYESAVQIFVYVNNNLQNEALSDLLEFVFDPDSTSLIAEAGFTPVGDDILERNTSALAGEAEGGRLFSLPPTSFEIPPSVSGTVRVAGSTNPVEYLTSLRQQFSSLYPGVTIDLRTLGEDTAIEAFCGGEGDIDILSTAAPLNANRAEICRNNGIDFTLYDLGVQSVVLLGNAQDEFNACLTTDQIRGIWASTATNNLTTWAKAVDGAPEQEIYTIAPTSGAATQASILLAQEEGPTLPMRTDATEYNNDPLYRAAAVANASGAVTFMNWPGYQEVLNSGITGYRLIAVDAGNGCIEPSLESLANGEYPYSQPATLTVRRTALGRPEVQSLLWYSLSDENFRLIENSGYVGGIALADLPRYRAELETLYAGAAALATAEEDETLFGFDPLATPDPSPDASTTNPPAEDQ